MVKTGTLVIALALLAAVVPQPAAAACDVNYRLWQAGENTYYKHGETIVLEVGEEADLYIHGYYSRSPDPVSAAADIGAPTDFRTGGQSPRDVSRVLRIKDQNPRKGWVRFTTVAAGETALAYRITDLVSPGKLEKIPEKCRTGQVRITVRPASRSVAPPVAPAVGSANEAAHALIVQLYRGILRRGAGGAADYPDSFFDQVMRDGQRGLSSIAETMTASPEFRDDALARTRRSLEASGVTTGGLSQAVVADQLLNDIFETLYGGYVPDPRMRNQLASKLNSCVVGGNATLCRQLGRDLLAQRQYYDNNRDHLALLPR